MEEQPNERNSMRKIGVGALALTVALVAGCGNEGDASVVRDTADVIEETAADVASVDLPEYLTEEEVSAAWEDRSQRKADGVAHGDIYVEVLDADCVVTDLAEGEARCTEEVKYGSFKVPSVHQTETNLWRVTYDPVTGVFRTVR
jgi:outer membrane murein-binding lipoprotein Lpp